GQMGEGSHGTQTLSLVAGYKPGNLISPAFRSRYLLAKTENTESETPLEEDNWIAAAEWADSLGADIITSSLGYIGMDQGSSHSYDWQWMNGDSCLITIGADLAVNKGIIVCNSAGNEGFHSTHNTLGAPSDGDSVIAVGSVNSDKKRSGFSSVGLTVDGRIKPDVVALGNGNIVAQSGPGNTGYSSGSGTSYSCPMTAGVCAVILSGNRNLTPMQMKQVLTQTADSSFAPNRRRGWGLINCWEALKLARNITGTGSNNNILIPEKFVLDQNYPNPFNPVTKIKFVIPQNGSYPSLNVKLIIYNSLGREISNLLNNSLAPGSYQIEFDGSDLPSGVYYYKLISDNFSDIKKMILIK
ncbi:MAG: S8 family serine peptidase, partial [Ignavibacteria bacterium]